MTTKKIDTETANKNIVNLLDDAGLDGLHSDDILYLLGYNNKKELVSRLKQLKNNNTIIEVEGGRWKKNKEDMNGTPTETFISPSCKEDLPSVYLPGMEKFSSYKNTLQEFCQKKKYPVPQYKPIRENNGLIGTVTFALNFVRSSEVSGGTKEADSRAAFQALQELGYLEGVTFQMTNQLKRKEDNAEYASTVAKIMKSGKKDPMSFKSQLNEYAQKRQVAIPKYDTVAVTGGFFSTVTFNDVKYKGSSICLKLKDAEKKAAHVALNALIGIPLSTDGDQMELCEAEVSKMIQEARQASTPVGLKNRLQEYCQRMSYALPVYATTLTENDKVKLFTSTVTVQGDEYTGSTIQGKKNSETSAAEIALKKLGLMA